MSKHGFLVLAALLFTSFSLYAQQSGTISAQQVMTTLAGMRSDISLMLEENKRLSLRVEELEETLRKKEIQYQDLQALCGSLAQQNQSLETRISDIQNALAADQKARAQEFQNLSKDLTTMMKSSSGNSAPANGTPVVPKGMELRDLVVQKGDNLSTIAKAAGCTVQQIMDANPQLKSPDALRVGQTLHIPMKKQ